MAASDSVGALSEAFFSKLEGVAPGSKLQTKIKYVGGSVQAACALGVADGIVDLVGTYNKRLAIPIPVFLTRRLCC